MNTFAHQLRESLEAPHKDPDKESMQAEDLQKMLDDLRAKIAEVNAAAQIRARRRTMEGRTDEGTLEDSIQMRSPLGQAFLQKISGS